MLATSDKLGGGRGWEGGAPLDTLQIPPISMVKPTATEEFLKHHGHSNWKFSTSHLLVYQTLSYHCSLLQLHSYKYYFPSSLEVTLSHYLFNFPLCSSLLAYCGEHILFLNLFLCLHAKSHSYGDSPQSSKSLSFQ